MKEKGGLARNAVGSSVSTSRDAFIVSTSGVNPLLLVSLESTTLFSKDERLMKEHAIKLASLLLIALSCSAAFANPNTEPACKPITINDLAVRDIPKFESLSTKIIPISKPARVNLSSGYQDLTA